MLQYILIFILLFLIAIPLGKYMSRVFSDEKQRMDRFFLPIERVIYRLGGIRDLSGMTWLNYVKALLLVNATLLGIAYLLLRLQGELPFNPNGTKGMESTLVFNTVASFMTNTNLQHYSGETELSHLSQMAVITMMMFTSAVTGLSVAIAFIRGLTRKGKTIGNFYEDFVRGHVRVMLPLAIIATLLLIAAGVPQTLDGNVTATDRKSVV